MNIVKVLLSKDDGSGSTDVEGGIRNNEEEEVAYRYTCGIIIQRKIAIHIIF